MNEFFEERIRLARQLIDRADPFTKVRLQKLAERYEDKLGTASRATRKIKLALEFPIVHSSEQ